ncbi:HAMP domain-containing protein [Ramlibacter sp. G-1-2-2]|uniref:histidine kinase n=1 Tax=Ramlibacter agri TaxID=2728837 RepID=A0A848H930_9BURK|nr:hybrid sensor histidine kinase/response regulator [Ramlibacter agri]NML45033.1 HAMP domain-containing protein [Ramlibacter agri]
MNSSFLRRMRILPSSLGRKYAIYFVAVVGTALLVSGLVQLSFTYRENQSAVLNLQAEKAAFAASRIEAYVREIEHQMGWMRFPRPAGTGEDQVRLDFLKLLRQVPAITDLMLLDAQGHERLKVSRLSADRVDPAADHSRDPRFVLPRQGETYFGPVSFRKETEPYMTIAVAEGGHAGGVIVADVNLKFIWDVISQIKAGENGSAYVVDADGRLIAHPDISLVLRKLDLSALPQVASARSHEDRTPRVTHGPDGAQVLSAHAEIPSLHWLVFVEQPVSEALGPVYAALRRTGLLLLLGLALAVLASIYVSRRMAKPIMAIGEGASVLAGGDLSHRIEIRTGDELEGLAGQVNHLAATLGDLYGNLERKVDLRTEELSEALREIRRKSAELEVAGRHKTEFLASMSHELRTPLNAIIGFSEALLERMFGELNEKQADYLADIHASGVHLLSLINDILDLSKIEAGRMDLELSRFDVPAALQSTLSLMRERASRSRVALRLDCDKVPRQWVADERKFKQIMINLLSNAVKFTPAGGEVSVSAATAADALEIAVQDTGIGIKAEDQELVFEEFRQASGAHPGKVEGSGLGLALARRLAELHGGTIRMQSQVGQGSTFVVRLPQQEVA